MLIRIYAVIVELFASVPIADVAPVFAANGVVFIIPSGEHWLFAFGFGVLEQWFQIEAV